MAETKTKQVDLQRVEKLVAESKQHIRLLGYKEALAWAMGGLADAQEQIDRLEQRIEALEAAADAKDD